MLIAVVTKMQKIGDENGGKRERQSGARPAAQPTRQALLADLSASVDRYRDLLPTRVM